VAVAPLTLRARAADYRELTKPGISVFLVVTAAAGFLLGTADAVAWTALLGVLAGTALTAGGAGALNHAAEHARDARMDRTSNRPIPAGRVSARTAVVYGLALAALGLLVLALTTNALTTALSALTIALYVAVYTPMKVRTPWNTLVGAVPGAMPVLGGWAAATGALGPAGWAAFGVLALWQFPHFLALAWLYRDDYARGGYRMLPSADPGGRLTGAVVLLSSLALLPVGLLPGAFGAAGWVYLVGMAAVGTAFAIPAFSFAAAPTDARARRVLFASFAYLPAFFVLVALDFLLR
jgi:protoheme IX farnesyltransferase